MTTLEVAWPDVAIKSSQTKFQKLPQKMLHSSVYLKVMIFKMAKKATEYLGYCLKIICCQELWKSPNLVAFWKCKVLISILG